MQINKKRRASERLCWGKSIGSRDCGTDEGGCREAQKWRELEVIRRAPNCMLKSQEVFFPEEMIVGDQSESSSLLNTGCVKCLPQAAQRKEEAGEVVTSVSVAQQADNSTNL